MHPKSWPHQERQLNQKGKSNYHPCLRPVGAGRLQHSPSPDSARRGSPAQQLQKHRHKTFRDRSPYKVFPPDQLFFGLKKKKKGPYLAPYYTILLPQPTWSANAQAIKATVSVHTLPKHKAAILPLIHLDF